MVEFLRRARRAVRADRVLLTSKAAGEAWDQLEWDIDDALAMLVELLPDDFLRTEPSTERPGDEVHVFCPVYDEVELWVRLVERSGIVVVSLHPR